MRFGLKEEVIEKINEVISNFSEVEEIILYGSRAKGNFKNGSDIDIAIKGKFLTHNILNKINLQLDDLLLPYTIDLILFSRVDNSELVNHINRVGMSIYKKGKKAG